MLVLGGSPTGVDVFLEVAPDHQGSALSIALSEDLSQSASWTFEVYVNTTQGRYFCGKFATVATFPGQGTMPSRIVAIAGIPGAKKWSVNVRGPQGSQCDVTLESSQGLSVSGLAVMSDNGDPINPRPRTSVSPGGAAALVASFVARTSFTRLFELHGFRAGVDTDPVKWFQIFDANALPVNGTRCLDQVLLRANTNFSLTPLTGCYELSNGLVWAMSTTASLLTLDVAAEAWARAIID